MLNPVLYICVCLDIYIYIYIYIYGCEREKKWVESDRIYVETVNRQTYIFLPFLPFFFTHTHTHTHIHTHIYICHKSCSYIYIYIYIYIYMICGKSTLISYSMPNPVLFINLTQNTTNQGL